MKNIMSVMIVVMMVCCVVSSVSAHDYRDYRQHERQYHHQERPRYEEQRHHRGDLGRSLVEVLVVGTALGIANSIAPPARYYNPPPQVCYQNRWVPAQTQWSNYYRSYVVVEPAHNERIAVPCY